jgi:hypothetical protein
MSMMGYYHELNKTELEYLPAFPVGSHVLNRRHFNVTEFTAGGREVGPSTGVAVWDSGSYGQYIGGTPRYKGRNKGFIDFGHVIGQGIIRAGCVAKFMCGNTSGEINVCRMAPYVQCTDTNWVPINNLHVHCKLTTQFRNVECPCRGAGMPYSPADEEAEREKAKALKESENAVTSGGSSGNTSALSVPISGTSVPENLDVIGYIPIVYFYTIGEKHCATGLPLYIKDIVTQAASTQSSDIYLISSFSRCKGFDLKAGYSSSIHFVDYDEIMSDKTKKFIETSVNILGSDGLWYCIIL